MHYFRLKLYLQNMALIFLHGKETPDLNNMENLGSIMGKIINEYHSRTKMTTSGNNNLSLAPWNIKRNFVKLNGFHVLQRGCCDRSQGWPKQILSAFQLTWILYNYEAFSIQHIRKQKENNTKTLTKHTSKLELFL